MSELYLGSGADVLHREFQAGSIDMIYSDPPFGNAQIWTGTAGSFSDKWTWDAAAERRWSAFAAANPVAIPILEAMAPRPADRAYLAMIGELLIECRRVLKPTGSLWLHFDDTMGAQLRVLGDLVFGHGHQIGTVIWKRSSSHANAKCFGRIHDTIACFIRSRAAFWRLARCNGEFAFGDPCFAVEVGGFADDHLNVRAKERVGYPTQKPVSLLERFISTATLPGDTVLDPTCGSGTTLVAATRLGRRAIGIDMSQEAIDTARARLSPGRPTSGQLDLFAEAA